MILETIIFLLIIPAALFAVAYGMRSRIEGTIVPVVVLILGFLWQLWDTVTSDAEQKAYSVMLGLVYHPFEGV